VVSSVKQQTRTSLKETTTRKKRPVLLLVVLVKKKKLLLLLLSLSLLQALLSLHLFPHPLKIVLRQHQQHQQ
jgi:hypothetical protein